MIRFFLVLVALLSIAEFSPGAVRPPNVVLILADDLGWGDLHCYGHPYSKTPNLDRLASEGTRFTQFYSTGVTCCPARTGLMTGRFPARYQKYPASFGFGECITITQSLKNAGYQTGHFGKWHIGPATSPGTYGIDVINAGDEERTKRDSERGRDATIYDSAIRFIEEHKDGPFYLNVWSHSTHHPINPAQRFVDEFKDLRVDESLFSDAQREKFATVRRMGGDVDDAMRRFLGDLASMDQDIGRLLTKLDELALRENTLVVFNADQGPAAPREDRKSKDMSDDKWRLTMNLLGYAGPEFRGGKHTDYEGGVRVPFLVRWPGRVPVGRVDDQSVLSGADWFPTICSLAGVPFELAGLDGEDASTALLGGVHTRANPLFWKTNADNSDASMRWGVWKLHAANRRRGTVELYDVGADPGEQKNLAQTLPERVEELSAKLKAWTDSLPKSYEHGDAKED
jgi:N-acetylgalactosamine-6-sulfatase